jgi:hypothetical protein
MTAPYSGFLSDDGSFVANFPFPAAENAAGAIGIGFYFRNTDVSDSSISSFDKAVCAPGIFTFFPCGSPGDLSVSGTASGNWNVIAPTARNAELHLFYSLFSGVAQVAPEPASMALFAIALTSLYSSVRRKRMHTARPRRPRFLLSTRFRSGPRSDLRGRA